MAWEYCMVRYLLGDDDDDREVIIYKGDEPIASKRGEDVDFVSTLNGLGSDGWEAFSHDQIFAFASEGKSVHAHTVLLKQEK